MDDLGAFLIRAPRGGPFTLRQRCMWALRGHYAEMIDKMIEKHTMESMDIIIHDIHSLIFSKWFNLPTEVVQAIIDSICASDNAWVELAVVLAALSLSEPRQHLLSLKLKITEYTRLDILFQWLNRAGAGLEHLEAKPDVHVDDDFLVSLCNAPIVGSLKTLSLISSSITDVSASVWQRLTLLEELRLDNCEGIGYETLQSLSLLPNLRSLDFWNNRDKDLTIEQVEELFGSTKFPQLQQLSIRLTHLMRTAPVKQRVLAIFQPRVSLTNLCIASGAGLITGIHSTLPHLASLATLTPRMINMEILQQILPSIGSFGQLSLSWNARGTELSLSSVAAYCTSLEVLQMHYGNSGSVHTDFSMFSSLKTLEISCSNASKVAKLPTSLTTLDIQDSKSQLPSTDKDRGCLMDALCILTNLKSLRLTLSDQVMTPDSFLRLTRSLTRLQELNIRQRSKASEIPTTVALDSMPHLSEMRLNIPNLTMSTVYLPALRSFPEQTSVQTAKCTPSQLPNLDSVDRTEVEEDNAPDIMPLMNAFATQLRAVTEAPKDISASLTCSWSNLESLSLQSTISHTEAQELLQNLGRLREFAVAMNLKSSNLDWIKHTRLAVCKLRLAAEEGLAQRVEPSLLFKSDHTPSLLSLSITLEDNKRISLSLHGLKNLRYLQLSAESTGDELAAASFAISSCPLVSRVEITSLEFNSFQVVDTKVVDIRLSGVRFRPDSENCSWLANWFEQQSRLAN